jgi:hypothetical protein
MIALSQLGRWTVSEGSVQLNFAEQLLKRCTRLWHPRRSMAMIDE